LLKQIKECKFSRELWLKLQSIYQSSGPARKATIIKQLAYHHMQEGENIHDHIQRFFDTVDRLSEMEVETQIAHKYPKDIHKTIIKDIEDIHK